MMQMSKRDAPQVEKEYLSVELPDDIMDISSSNNDNMETPGP